MALIIGAALSPLAIVAATPPAAAQSGPPAEAGRPVGAAEYARLTERYTTQALTADQVRAIGHKELDRILADVRGVMAGVGFEGTLEEFFDFLRTDDRFYYPDTDKGRAAYLADARRVFAKVEPRLSELVETPPDAAQSRGHAERGASRRRGDLHGGGRTLQFGRHAIGPDLPAPGDRLPRGRPRASSLCGHGSRRAAGRRAGAQRRLHRRLGPLR
jgi:hypothetical protein